MSIDKTWTTMPPNCEEFWKGLDAFVERAELYIDNKGQIRCPCRRCLNYNFMDIPTMKNHISRFGFCQRYVTWVYHGESRTPPIVNDIAPSNEMVGVIDDIMGEFRENDTNHSAQSRISRPTQPNQLDVMLRNPAFREAMEAAITNVMQSFSTENNNLEDDANEDDNRDE